MSIFFQSGISTYLANSSPSVVGLPFSVGIWVNLAAVGAVNRTIWALSDTATSTNYYEIGMDSGENARVGLRSGGGEATFLAGMTFRANRWAFLLARFRTSTFRCFAGYDGNGLVRSTINTSSMAPAGLDLMTLGAISTSQGLNGDAITSVPWAGQIAEFWIANTDVYPSASNTDISFLMTLAYGGPFAFTNIADNIVEYRSFRKHPASEADGSNEVYFTSSQTVRWTNVNGVRIASHVPLTPWYPDGFTPMAWRAIKQGWMVSTIPAGGEQQFVRFPVRMDGIGYGGIFPGGRLQDKMK